jgi:hypothetical protein
MRCKRTEAKLPGYALLAQQVEHLHGKEGVDGSSPSEGFAKALETGALSQMRRRSAPAIGFAAVPDRARRCEGFDAVDDSLEADRGEEVE